MLGCIIFLIGIMVGGELARRYTRKMKTKYSSEDFKRRRPRFLAVIFLIWFVVITIGAMLCGLVSGKGLQVVASLKLSLLVIACGVILNGLELLFKWFDSKGRKDFK